MNKQKNRENKNTKVFKTNIKLVSKNNKKCKQGK